MTQHEAIIDYLQKNKSISPYEAFAYLGITKLSTRIGELIKAGYSIDKRIEKHTNIYVKTTPYVRYSLGV